MRHRLVFCLLVALATCITAKAMPADRPYLVAIPFAHAVTISGDGRVLLVNGQLWTEADGFIALRGTPDGYGIWPTAINYDGTVVAGEFSKQVLYQSLQHLEDFGIFRWTMKTGVQLLTPHLYPGPIKPAYLGPGAGPAKLVSDDGQEILFSCFGQSDLGSDGRFNCNSGPLPDQSYSAEKIWTSTGIEYVGQKFGHKFQNVSVSDDFQNILVADSNLPSLGRIDAKDRYIKFQNYTGLQSTDDPLVMNRDASFVAVNQDYLFGPPEIWDASGQLLAPLKLLPGCKSYKVIAIDETGTIFINAECPALQGPYFGRVGLRVSPQGVQTISDWLKSNGLPNTLPPYASIQVVSDNGKTIFGTLPGPPVVSSADPENPAVIDASYRSEAIQLYGAFVAHVP